MILPYYFFKRPVVPRPYFASFEKFQYQYSELKKTQNIYIGTQGRGVWKLSIELPSFYYDICKIKPHLCYPIEYEPPFVIYEVLEIPSLFTIDIPEICTKVIDCPGCDGSALCPPYYNIFIEGLDMQAFDPVIYTKEGQPIHYDVKPNERMKGAIISFRPEKRMFREQTIGDYKLGIIAKDMARKGKYRLKIRIERSKKPYDLEAKLRPLSSEEL